MNHPVLDMNDPILYYVVKLVGAARSSQANDETSQTEQVLDRQITLQTKIEESAYSDWVISPNPTNNTINISNRNDEIIHSISIIDSYGNTLNHFYPDDKTSEYSIHLVNYSSDVYTILINQNTYRKAVKL